MSARAISLVLILGTVLAACQQPQTETSPTLEPVPATTEASVPHTTDAVAAKVAAYA